MKRFILVSIILVFAFGMLAAHEVSANLSVSGDPDGDGSDAKGFYVGNLCLTWADKDYNVEMDFTKFINQDEDFSLTKAWKRVDLWGLADLTIGKKQSIFGRIRSSKGSNNVQIFKLPQSYSDWSVMLDRSWKNVHAYGQGMWPMVGAADVAGRLSYETKAFTAGAAINVRNIKGDDDDMVNGRFDDWEVDAECTIAKAITIASQLTNCDDNNDDTDDMNVYAIMSMTRGFELPYINQRMGRMFYGTIHPYAGIITKDDADGDGMKENNIITGLKMAAFEGSYIKAELNLDSLEDVDPGVIMQFGYCF